MKFKVGDVVRRNYPNIAWDIHIGDIGIVTKVIDDVDYKVRYFKGPEFHNYITYLDLVIIGEKNAYWNGITSVAWE